MLQLLIQQLDDTLAGLTCRQVTVATVVTLGLIFAGRACFINLLARTFSLTSRLLRHLHVSRILQFLKRREAYAGRH